MAAGSRGKQQDRAPAPTGPAVLAIDRHLEEADGAPPERRFLPARSRTRGPLAEVDLYRLERLPYRGAPDHWHLVTKGLSELGEKDSERPDLSGWGFELSFRVVGAAAAHPEWAVDLLTNLAGYVWSTSLALAPGHLVDLRRPIHPGSSLSAAVMALDPGLGGFVGPNGALEFLQVVPLSGAELQLCDGLDPARLIEMISRDNSMLVCDPGRPDLSTDPSFAAEAHLRSSQVGGREVLRVGGLAVRYRRGMTTLSLGAGTAAAVARALRSRLDQRGGQDSLRVVGPDIEIRIVPADSPRWEAGEGRITLWAPESQIAGLAELLESDPGMHTMDGWTHLRVRVVG